MTYVAAGYLVSRVIPRPTYSSAALVVDEVWSASQCLAPRLGEWALAWVDVERAEPAAAMGVSDLDALVAWATDAFEAERFGWPDVFRTLDAAREARDRFAPSARIFALALREDHVDDFVDDLRADVSKPGLVAGLLRDRPLPEGGTPRGFEVLYGNGFGGLHDYLCRHHEAELAALGLRSGVLGLFADEADAERAAAHLRVERGDLWLAWKVVEYE
ncbi:MAG: hypothetical protein KC586_22790 [Myxococcales bacterium]|nr:hypothetical protein [Myxococcales bacterium]